MADALAGWVAAEAGRTYKGLASAAGVGPASPANWARGDSRVSLEAAYRLAEVMGVPLSSLLTGRDAGLTPEPDRWQMMGALTAVSTREAISKRPSHRQLMDYLPARVSVLMADPDAPTYTREQVGQHLGCFYSTFQKNYPAECEILRQRRRELRALRWAGSRRSRKRLAALARSSAQPQATR